MKHEKDRCLRDLQRQSVQLQHNVQELALRKAEVNEKDEKICDLRDIVAATEIKLESLERALKIKETSMASNESRVSNK